jgi:hypothetical protein
LAEEVVMSETNGGGRWVNDRRIDGLVVVRIPSRDDWMIIPAQGPALTTCPCCDKPFPTAKVARLVADAVYPIQGQQ